MNKEQSFGKALKQLRESNNIKLDQISSFTKINKKSLEKLEGGDFSFAEIIYVRLFLREYIKYIDPQKTDSIINEFENLTDNKSSNKNLTFLPSTPEDKGELDPENNEVNSNSYFPKNRDYTPKKIAMIILVVIIIICLYQVVIFFSTTT